MCRTRFCSSKAWQCDCVCEWDTLCAWSRHGQTLLRLTSWDNDVSMTCRGGCLNDAFLSANMTVRNVPCGKIKERQKVVRTAPPIKVNVTHLHPIIFRFFRTFVPTFLCSCLTSMMLSVQLIHLPYACRISFAFCGLLRELGRRHKVFLSSRLGYPGRYGWSSGHLF
jgi:hypothetical protein